MSRKAIAIIIVFIVLILIAVSVWLIIRKLNKSAGSPGGDQNPPPYDYIPPSYSGGGAGYSSASFPIKQGMSGQMVTDVQDSINKKCNSNLVTDGKFGPLTGSALKSCYNVTQVSQALYTQMKLDGGSAPIVSSTGFNSGDKIYLKANIADIYSYPAFSSSYIVGSLDKVQFTDKPIGYYTSPATGGFVKIKVFGYKPYGKTAYIVDTKDVYISSSSIQKTPF